MEQDRPSNFSDPQGIDRTTGVEEGAADRSQSAPTVVGQLNPTVPVPFFGTEDPNSQNPLGVGQPSSNPTSMDPSNQPSQNKNDGPDPEVDPLLNSTINDLRSLQHPLTMPRNPEGSFDSVRLRMTMLQPAYTFLNDPWKVDVRARYDKLVELGMSGLGRPEVLPDRHLTRNERAYFKGELQLLDRVLTEVFQYQSPEGALGYTIKYSLFNDFQGLLSQTRVSIGEKISPFARDGLPENPVWGPDNRPVQYWEPEDFEILGVNFRLQVEKLLVALADGIRDRNRERTLERTKGKQRARSSDLASQPAAGAASSNNPPPMPPPTNTSTPPFQGRAPPTIIEVPRSPSSKTRTTGRSRTERSSSRESSSESPQRHRSCSRPTNNPFKNTGRERDTSNPRFLREPTPERYEQGRKYSGQAETTSQAGAESSVSRYRPSSPVRPSYNYTDPRPSILRPTFPTAPPQTFYPSYPSTPPFNFVQPNLMPPTFGTIRDNTTSSRLQQLLAPSRATKPKWETQFQPFNPHSYPYPMNNVPGMATGTPFYQGENIPPPPGDGNQVPGGVSAPAPGGGGGDEPSDSDNDRKGRLNRDRRPRIPRDRGRGRRGPRERDTELSESSTAVTKSPPEPRFDTKFCLDIIPTWNGNPDNLGRWIMKINRLARQSQAMYEQLGGLVPTRLEGTAEKWYYSLSSDTRTRLEENWDSLRQGICDYFMNQTWMENQKVRANNAKYWESGYGRESPSDYFIRKLELLQLNFNYTDRELIMEIMAGFPTHWTPILTPHLYYHIEQLQAAVKFFEETLLKMDSPRPLENQQSYQRYNPRNPFNPFRNSRVNTNLAEGGTKASPISLSRPQFPKDDTNVSKRGTPDSVGKRPCRHCGSGKHWDYECKHSRRGERIARTNLVEYSHEELEEQLDYDDTYYALDSDEEDFHSALLDQEA